MHTKQILKYFLRVKDQLKPHHLRLADEVNIYCMSLIIFTNTTSVSIIYKTVFTRT